MKFFITIILSLFSIINYAQELIGIDTANSITNLSEIIVYSNKFPEKAKRVTQTVNVLDDKKLINNQSNTADALINSGNIFVQKSQQGGGSPVIRGFEASRVLLMIDGVRLNNAIYRAGHLQNIITIDNTILDRMEVLYGPSSTIYGSDALGGVINMYTKNPSLSLNQKNNVAANTLFRFSSANNEAKIHVDFNIAAKKWAYLTSLTLGKFGDVVQGNQRLAAYPDFGKKNFYVERINGVDSALVNSNPNKQIASGYHQIDFVQKILFQPKTNVQHSVNFQISTTGDIPRYDRLTEVSGTNPSYAEWNYGPQKRNMIAYQFSKNNSNSFFKEVKLNANYQNIEESRITRRFKNNNRDSRIEKVDVFGFSLDAKHYLGKNEIHLGFESYYNKVNSTAFRQNIATGIQSKISTRYADGATNMTYSGAYFQHTFKISDQLTLNEGVRLNLVTLNANFVDTSILHLPFTNASQNNLAITGNLGLVYVSKNNIRISTLLSSGFRSQNVDDLTKVFDTKPGYVVVPNKDIKPERTYNAEINFSQSLAKFSYGFSVYYTQFTNAIVVDKFSFNGQSTINYQGVTSDVYAPQNKAGAYIYGFNVNTSLKLSSSIKADATYTYTYGRYNNNNTTIPLDHIPPTFGRVALQHQSKQCFFQLSTLFNGWKKIENYNLNGEDNEQYATKDGMPSWMIFNIQSAFQLSKQVNLNLSVENIFDKNYRYFASGISAAGRNFVVSLKTQF
jgi:hemoglobin/transferrin/lactoferrin receptor protein